MQYLYLVEFALDEGKFFGAVETVMQMMNKKEYGAGTYSDEAILILLILHFLLCEDWTTDVAAAL